MNKIETKILNCSAVREAEKNMVFAARLTQRGHMIHSMDDLVKLYEKSFLDETVKTLGQLPHPAIQKFTVITVAVVGASRRFLSQITRHQNEVKFMSASLQYSNYSGEEKYGDTPYIFVDDKDTAHAMPYTKVQYRVTAMIYDKDLRDDNGELFGFSTHIYRHYYGVKLTEMHLDDWTIAKLLGHSSVRNVKYYRKMSNQLLADETRKARQKLSAIILNNLDGWEDEYEQIRKDGRL